MRVHVEAERAMAEARKHLDWEQQLRLYLDPVKSRHYRESSNIGSDDACTMCGEFCAIKRLRE